MLNIGSSKSNPGNDDWSPAEFIWQSQAGLVEYDDLLIAMLKAYYDASGKEDTGRVSVAGWVSTARRWVDFETNWNAALDYFGIPYFHASTFEFNGEHFADWRGDDTRKAELIQRLVAIVKDAVLFGVASTIYYDDFAAAAEIHPEVGVQFKNAYVLAARDCMKRSEGRARKLKMGAVEHIFEQGDIGMGRLTDLCRDMGEGAPQFHFSTPHPNRKHLVQLQSADLFAYECFQLTPQRHAERFRPVYLDEARQPARLLYNIPKEWHEYDYKATTARALHLLYRNRHN